MMNRMFKRFALSLTLLMLLVCLCLNAQAAPSRLADNANLLTAGERASLAKRLDEISQKYGVDVVIATTNNTRGMEIGMYAADLVDYNAFKADNIIFVIAMDIREFTCVTTGSCITAFTDDTLERMYDAMQRDMGDGKYAAACDTYIDLCGKVLAQAEKGNPYDVGHPLVVTPFIVRFAKGLVISAIPGFLIGWLVARARKKAMKTARPQRSAESYLKSMKLTRERDIYLYTTTTRRLIETSSGGGGGRGGSSTFRGSSGRSHGGGGGRKF